jgi:hypothetical protein
MAVRAVGNVYFGYGPTSGNDPLNRPPTFVLNQMSVAAGTRQTLIPDV